MLPGRPAPAPPAPPPPTPPVEHRDAVGEHVDDGEIVADKQGGEAEIALDLGEQLEHPGLHGHVERAGGLVGDQQGRLEGERTGEARALALPAGELVREPVAERLGAAALLRAAHRPVDGLRGSRRRGRGR